MRPVGALLAATLPAALAAQQQVLPRPTGVLVGEGPISMASTPALANSTKTTVTERSTPLTTAAAEKPAFEASVMGLIVFSAAGLYLL